MKTERPNNLHVCCLCGVLKALGIKSIPDVRTLVRDPRYHMGNQEVFQYGESGYDKMARAINMLRD